jgi:hypothetical protein
MLLDGRLRGVDVVGIRVFQAVAAGYLLELERRTDSEVVRRGRSSAGRRRRNMNCSWVWKRKTGRRQSW